MALSVKSITFNINPNDPPTNKALNIRRDFANEIVVPEYQQGGANEPAAYARDQIVNNGGKVRLIVELAGADPNAIWGIRARGGGVLGEVPGRDIQFDGQGSARVGFELTPGWSNATPISRNEITWQWEYAPSSGVVIPFGTTKHTIYVVLDTPNNPWNAGPANQQPWVTALELACTWASGARNTGEATDRITEKLNGCGVVYIPATIFMLHGDFSNYFLLSLFLLFVRRAAENMGGFRMNCTDCASATTTLSNLIGAKNLEGSFKGVSMGLFNPPIYTDLQTKQILGIGGNPTTDWSPTHWSYHEICWAKYELTGHIWDAALRLGPPSPNFAGDLPEDMTFNPDYLSRLLKDPTVDLVWSGCRPVI